MFQYVLLNKKKTLITLKTFYLIKGHMWKQSSFSQLNFKLLKLSDQMYVLLMTKRVS